MTIRSAQESCQILVAAKRSQAAIAERAGVKQPTIGRILSGEIKDPAGSILIKLNEFADEVLAEEPELAAQHPPAPAPHAEPQ